MKVFVRFSGLRFTALLLFPLAVSTAALAQDTAAPGAPSPDNPAIPNPIVTLASQFFEHDFFNFFAYGDGIHDSYGTLGSPSRGSFGWSIGGGVNGIHTIKDGSIALSYSGSYNDYQGGPLTSGTNQNLALAFNKRLTRRWMFSFSTYGGIFLYGGTIFNVEQVGTNTVETNPFSPETRFLGSGVSLAYQQTRRLTYIFSGGFNLMRYNYPGAIGLIGGSGTASVQYRLGPRTTVGGSYSYSDFQYQHNIGQDTANSVGANLSHQFRSRYSVNLYAGVVRSDASGIVAVPVTLLVGNRAVGGYVIGKYHETTDFPSFSGSLTRSYRGFQLQVSGGQGISGGNGYYLASKTRYVYGVVSHAFNRKSAVSLSGGYSELSSIANSVASQYSSASINAAYSISLMRYVGANVQYNYIYYGNLSPYSSTSDNRILFGINFSSKSVPLTVF